MINEVEVEKFDALYFFNFLLDKDNKTFFDSLYKWCVNLSSF